MVTPPSHIEYRDIPLFFAAYDTVEMPICISDGEGKIRWINQAMEEWTRTSRDTVAGMENGIFFTTIIAPLLHDGSAFAAEIENAGARAETVRHRICHTHEDGAERRWFDFSSVIVRNGTQASGRIDIFKDITVPVSLRRAEKHQKVLQALVAEISAMLVATPLTAIEDTIRKALRRLGEGTGVSRCHLFLMREDGSGRTFEYEWDARAASPGEGLSGVTVFPFPRQPETGAGGRVLKTVSMNGTLQSHAVPLHGRTLGGFLCLDMPAGDLPLLTHNQHLLRMTGDMFINVLESLQTDEGLRRHDTLCESVMNASGSLLRSAGWEDDITGVLSTLGKGAGVHRVYLFEVCHEDENGMRLFEWHTPDLSPGIAPGDNDVPWKAGGMEAWSAALALGHVITGITADLPSRIRSIFSERHVKSFAIIPVRTGEGCFGYIGFEDCQTARSWTRTEIEALKTAADSLGLMILRKMKDQKVKQFNTQLTLINGIVGAAASVSSLEDIIGETLRSTMKFLSVKAGAVYLLYPEKHEGQRFLIERQGPKPEFPAKIDALTPAIAPVLAGTPVYEAAAGEGHPRCAWIPLVGGTAAPVGVMALLLRDDHPFAAYEKQALDAVGREFGAAITRGFLQERLEDSIEKANLYLDIMAHDIKNATTVSIMYADMLREMVHGEPLEFSEKLMDSIRRTVEITDHVSTIRRLHEEAPVLKPMDLDAIIKKEITRFPKTTIHYSPSSFLVCADDLISEIFYNLIGNSVKFGGEDVEVFIRVEERQPGYEITVEDTGQGIPDTLKNVIFDRFQRGTKKAAGKGLGLYIVRTLVERYGGTISVHDRVPGHAGQGASIRFTLKKAE
ncbi:MAG: hypothetical protein APR53_08650 [Methanoculleus sp. SDB]|nr:MAG: hypothetical protein APR53_08650 [Methanoculleus sp. SDB]